MTHEFDFIILGGGAAAFAASTKASELGAKTLMINDGLPIGGTCVNVGCVPSKHLLEVGKEIFYPQRPRFEAVAAANHGFDFVRAIREKNQLVETLRQANYLDVLEHQKQHVTFLKGRAEFILEDEVTVNGERYRAKKFLIATGSSTRIIPFSGLDHVKYLTNVTVMNLEKQPQTLIVIGAGPLGLEFAQMFAHFGTKVTVIEIEKQILPLEEPQIAAELHKNLAAEGITIYTSARMQSMAEENGRKIVNVEVNGEKLRLEADELLMATGVVGNVKNLGLEKIGVELEKSSYVKVDKYFRTSVDNIYAAGDVIGPPFLETIAAKEGNFAAQNALKKAKKTINFDEVPHAVFTSPEVAAVGLTEAEYMRRYKYCYCKTIDFTRLPKALAIKDTRGVIKMVIHHEKRTVMGVHICAPLAADMIHEATLAVKFGLTIDDIIDMVHVFPTFSEAIKLVAQSFVTDIGKMSCCVV
ncbi:mercury(II) reductase [candidate division KSB1 bacterium]|nr:mercury(II) reductase [candidate division KSB1 bacterium]